MHLNWDLGIIVDAHLFSIQNNMDYSDIYSLSSAFGWTIFGPICLNWHASYSTEHTLISSLSYIQQSTVTSTILSCVSVAWWSSSAQWHIQNFRLGGCISFRFLYCKLRVRTDSSSDTDWGPIWVNLDWTRLAGVDRPGLTVTHVMWMASICCPFTPLLMYTKFSSHCI